MIGLKLDNVDNNLQAKGQQCEAQPCMLVMQRGGEARQGLEERKRRAAARTRSSSLVVNKGEDSEARGLRAALV